MRSLFFVPQKKEHGGFQSLCCVHFLELKQDHMGFACFNMKDLHSSTLNYTSPNWTRKPFSFSQLGKLEICSFENCRFQDLLLCPIGNLVTNRGASMLFFCSLPLGVSKPRSKYIMQWKSQIATLPNLYIYIHITLKKNETVLGTRKVFQRTTTCTTTFCFLGDFRGYVARMVVGCPDSIHCFTRLPLELQQNMPRWQGNDMFFFNREVSLGVVDCLIVK